MLRYGSSDLFTITIRDFMYVLPMCFGGEEGGGGGSVQWVYSPSPRRVGLHITSDMYVRMVYIHIHILGSEVAGCLTY